MLPAKRSFGLGNMQSGSTSLNMEVRRSRWPHYQHLTTSGQEAVLKTGLPVLVVKYVGCEQREREPQLIIALEGSARGQ